MKTITNKKPRKKLFVNRAIQGRLLGRATAYWFLYHGVLWISLFLFQYAEHRGAMLAGAAPRKFSDLYLEFGHEHAGIWVCAIAILPIVLWDLLCFSHRVVGPLVRFRNTLDGLATGQTVTKIRLRDGDLLNELNDAFNRYLASLPANQSNTPDSAKLDVVEDTIALEVRQILAEAESMASPMMHPMSAAVSVD